MEQAVLSLDQLAINPLFLVVISEKCRIFSSAGIRVVLGPPPRAEMSLAVPIRLFSQM